MGFKTLEIFEINSKQIPISKPKIQNKPFICDFDIVWALALMSLLALLSTYAYAEIAAVFYYFYGECAGSQ